MSNSPEGHQTASTSAGPGGGGAKRGARACASCRKGKNRCVPDDFNSKSCRKCAASGSACVFEPPPAKLLDEERVERMEHSIHSLHQTVQALVGLIRPSVTGSQGSQTLPPFNSLASGSFQTNSSPSGPAPMDYQSFSSSEGFQPNSRSNAYSNQPNQRQWEGPAGGSNSSSGSTLPGNQEAARGNIVVAGGKGKRRRETYPPLPNFRAPPHPISRYGLLPSAAPSDDEDDTLPKSSLTAPFEALAEAAAAAAASGSRTREDERENLDSDTSEGRVSHKRRRRAPIPPNAFPDVMEKGLVSEATGRELHALYFQHCNHFFPILDIEYDTFESIRERSPWTTDSILLEAASRIPQPTPEEVSVVEVAGEEAHGIARSSLFGPTVRIEGVIGMTLLAAWSDNGYLATGHALRMGFDLGIHLSLGKLVEDEEQKKVRKREEERDLVVSARTLLCLYQLDYFLSSGSGRPHCFEQALVDQDKLAAFLRHPLSIDSDLLLVAQVELVSLRLKIEATLKGFGTAQGTALDSRVLEYARTAADELKGWWKQWDARVGEKFASNSIERSLLLCSLHAATIFLFTSVLKSTSMSDTDVSKRELAGLARDAATSYIEICLSSPDFLRHATHSTFVEAAFSGLLLLKLSRLFPDGSSLSKVVKVTTKLAETLRNLPGAHRFGKTISIALNRFTKTFALELSPKQEDAVQLPSLADSLGLSKNLTPPSNPNSTSGLLNILDQDALRPLSDPSWPGTELYPQWLTNDSQWTFEASDLSQGLDRIFLPLWSQDLE